MTDVRWVWLKKYYINWTHTVIYSMFGRIQLKQNRYCLIHFCWTNKCIEANTFLKVIYLSEESFTLILKSPPFPFLLLIIWPHKPVAKTKSRIIFNSYGNKLLHYNWKEDFYYRRKITNLFYYAILNLAIFYQTIMTFSFDFTFFVGTKVKLYFKNY